MSLSHGILGFLNYGKMSGYDLAGVFGSSVGFFWHAQNSHIYLELNKLEKNGYVTCQLVTQTDKPNKKLYSITDAGRQELIRWLEEDNPDFTKSMKDSFLMKVFFSGNLPPEKSKKMLRSYIADCQNYLDSMEQIPDQIETHSSETSSHAALYWQFTADFGYRYIKMCMEWAENCTERLSGLYEHTCD